MMQQIDDNEANEMRLLRVDRQGREWGDAAERRQRSECDAV